MTYTTLPVALLALYHGDVVEGRDSLFEVVYRVACKRCASQDGSYGCSTSESSEGSYIDLYGLYRSLHNRRSRFCAAAEETREERIDKDVIMMKDLKMAIQEKHYYHWAATNGHVDAVNVKRNPFQAT